MTSSAIPMISRVSIGIAGLAMLGFTGSCNAPMLARGTDRSPAPVQVTSTGSVALEPAPADAPRIVVAVIFDQLGSDTLLAHLDLLDRHGAIRRAIDNGVYLERSQYSYANTLTAPGHTAVHTGAPPLRSGIDGNSTWDSTRRQAVNVINDPSCLVFGREAEGVGASPKRLRVPTVANALRVASGGAAKIISLSIKARSAILSVGTAADLVLWFDSKLGAFTTSRAWGPMLPEWLVEYEKQHPITALLVPWTPEQPESYAARLGPDAAPGEGDLDGFGISFPHRFDALKTPIDMLEYTPMLSEYLVALAAAAAQELHLGEDDVPDLIALSISGTDSAGHLFGPRSWEYVDHLVRADRALGAWLGQLEQQGPVSVLITSDHGVAPLPEASPAPAGRLEAERLQQRLEDALIKPFGAGPWVAGVLPPFVHLTERVDHHPERARLLAVARAALLEDASIRDAWTLDTVRSFGDGDPLERSLRLTVAPDDEADLLVLARPYHPLDLRAPPERGTNHGSPYDYDREVPVLAWGPGVPRLRSAEAVDQMRVAATLAHLLHIPKPASAELGSLF